MAARKKAAPEAKTIQIKAPNFQTVQLEIVGTAPLVICRFSEKAKNAMLEKAEEGTTARSKKVREKLSTDDLYEAARYHGTGGWDGFHASAIRNAMISACRLVGFKMTLAKLCVFAIEDDWDTAEPQIPLIRIHGKPVKQIDVARNKVTQTAAIAVRAAYRDWKAKLRIRFDADQFTAADIANLLLRAGMQVGIGVGRPDSTNSAGCGWGTFVVSNEKAA